MELDYNPRAKECIDRAKHICKELGGTAVNPMDIFLSTLLSRYNVIQMFLTSCTSDPISLIQSAADYCKDLKRVPKKKISWKPEASRCIKQASKEAEKLSTPYIGVDHIFTSCLKNSKQVSDFLAEIGVNAQDFYNAFYEFNQTLHEQKIPMPHEGPAQTAQSTSYIDKYCDHINSRVLNKNFQFFGRMDEINAAMTALCRKQKSNVLFVGEAGVGKTALVEGLALAMERPPKETEIAFPKMDIFELKLADMIAGAIYRGDFEKRLNETIREIKEMPSKTVVFIDEMHMVVGAGDRDGAMDAANILKPALANGEISCIGATTFAEYKKYIEKDSALSRRFEVIQVREPSPEETVDILNHCRASYEEYHSVKFSENAVKALVEAADTHMPYRRFPDKAFDLLDEAGTFFKLKQCRRPDHIVELEDELKEFIASGGASSDSENKKYDKKIKQFREEMEKWTDKISEAASISEADINHFINSKFNLDKKATNLNEFLKLEICGQEKTINEFVLFEKSMTMQRRKNKPVFSILLAGTTGTGKTLFATRYAEYSPLKQEGLVAFDMSHYSDGTSINKLIGSSAGYVGYDKGGVLTEKLKNNPKLILLFENIEKAHPAVLDLILNMVTDGFLQDNIGQKIDCARCKIFFTTRHINHSESLGFGQESSTLSVNTKLVPRAILDVVDRHWILNPLTQNDLITIARKRIADAKLNMYISEAVYAHLASLCDPKDGARPLISKAEEHIIGAFYEKLDDSNKNKQFEAKVLDKSIEINILECDE